MESSTTTAMAGVPAEGRAIVHERRDSEKDLNAMFERLANPSSAAAARGRPMRERKLPASFFSPSATNFCVPSAQGSNNIGHHSREGSADSSYSSQSSTMQKSPAHHFRSVSEPVQSCLSRTNTGIGIGSDDGQLPPGVQAAVTATGQRYFIDHINKTTSWEDPRQSTMYAPTSQQKRNIAAGAGGAGQTPFYQPTNSAAVAAAALAASSMQGSASSTDALRLDALSKMQALQSIEQQQQHQQHRQRSVSWIDPRGAVNQRQQNQARYRMLMMQQQQQQQFLQQQQELLFRQELLPQKLDRELSLMLGEDLGGGGLSNQVAATAGSVQAAPHCDPVMPVTGSVSPDLGLQMGAPSPASATGTALAHIRDGSTDSGFGLGAVEPGLTQAAGLDLVGGQFDPMVGNPGMFSSLANQQSMSPIPGVDMPRPTSAASGSFLRQGMLAQNDFTALAAMDSHMGGGVGMPMETDDLSGILEYESFIAEEAKDTLV